MPSLVAVACFLPGRAKDLSAPPRRVSVRECDVRSEQCRHSGVTEGSRAGPCTKFRSFCFEMTDLSPDVILL